METKKISDLTDVELKAEILDRLDQMETLGNVVKALRQEQFKRFQAKPTESKEVKPVENTQN